MERHHPSKCMVMDVVVVDVPLKYGMLFSRSWGAKLQGTMQMDGAYATIPIFGQLRTLYREAQMKFLVSGPEKPKNSPIYSVHTDLDSFIFCNDESLGGPESENVDTSKGTHDETELMDFNIMATLDSEDEDIENLEQCTETIMQSEPET